MDLSRKSVLNEVLWSDPTDSDERVGCHPNARGPNTVSYGPDRVKVRSPAISRDLPPSPSFSGLPLLL